MLPDWMFVGYDCDHPRSSRSDESIVQGWVVTRSIQFCHDCGEYLPVGEHIDLRRLQAPTLLTR